MKNKLLILFFIVLSVVVVVEITTIVLIDKKLINLSPNVKVSSNSSTTSAVLPNYTNSTTVETGLFGSYIYFFEIRKLDIAKKTSLVTEYEGVIRNVEFVRGASLVYYFEDFDGWFSIYKKPDLLTETKCQVYDKTKGFYVNYTFDVAPFKKGDKVNVVMDTDYTKGTISCKIKVIDK